MEKSRAQLHFENHKYDFELSTEDGPETKFVYCTTEVAQQFAQAMAELGAVISVTCPHPEFLGWTVEEIEEALPEDEAK